MVVSNNHLPGWLQKALLAPNPVRVTFPDAGYVLLDPGRDRYESVIEDWASVPAEQDDAVLIAPWPQAMAEPDGRPLTCLKWAITLGHLRKQPPANYEFRYSLIRLASWPCLTHLPEEAIPVVARICALLGRKPTTASLIPLTLGMSEEQLFPLIEALRLNNHLQISGVGNSEASTPGATTQASAEDIGRQSENSLIGKIWQRLGIRS